MGRRQLSLTCHDELCADNSPETPTPTSSYTRLSRDIGSQGRALWTTPGLLWFLPPLNESPGELRTRESNCAHDVETTELGSQGSQSSKLNTRRQCQPVVLLRKEARSTHGPATRRDTPIDSGRQGQRVILLRKGGTSCRVGKTSHSSLCKAAFPISPGAQGVVLLVLSRIPCRLHVDVLLIVASIEVLLHASGCHRGRQRR